MFGLGERTSYLGSYCGFNSSVLFQRLQHQVHDRKHPYFLQFRAHLVFSQDFLVWYKENYEMYTSLVLDL